MRIETEERGGVVTQGLDAGVLGLACADNGEALTDGRASKIEDEGDPRASGASYETKSRPHGDECRARPSSCHAKTHKIRSQQPISKVHGVRLTDCSGLVEVPRTYCGPHRHATIDKVKCSASFASFSTPLRPIEAGAPTS